MEIVTWGSLNFELVRLLFRIGLQILLLSTHCVLCRFFFLVENSCLRQVGFWACTMFLKNLIGDCFVTHAWCPLSVFFCDRKSLVEAGGIWSLCNVSWKSDWRLFHYAHMVCAVCILVWWKILALGRWNFKLVPCFLKIWLEIFLLRIRGVHCVFFF